MVRILHEMVGLMGWEKKGLIRAHNVQTFGLYAAVAIGPNDLCSKTIDNPAVTKIVSLTVVISQ